MNDRSAIMLGALAGAIVGGACGFLFLTERGRQIREDLEPRISELVNEFQRVRLTAERARQTRDHWRRDQPFDPSDERAARSGDGR